MLATFINTTLLLITAVAVAATMVAVVFAAFVLSLRRKVAALGRALQRVRSAAPAPRICPACGSTWPHHQFQCCFRRTSPKAGDLAALADIEAALRTLDRLEQHGKTPSWSVESVRQGLLQQRGEILARYRAPEVPLPQPTASPQTPESVRIEALPVARPVVETPPRRLPPAEPVPLAELPQPQRPSPVEEPEPSATVPAQPDVKPGTAGPPEEPVGRMSWRDLLTSFMEEKNILWGEVAGGLLIVGGAIALVVSLWHTLERNPYFPFAIFASITAGLYAGGLYTWKHWRLQATSRGLLVIAALMTPLAYLVLPSMLGVSGGEAAEIPVAVTVALLFGWFLWRTAPIIAPWPGWALPVGVMVPAVSSWALVGIEVPQQGPIVLAGLLAIPTLTFLGANAPAILRFERRTDVDNADAGRLFALLGLSGFSLAVAIVFLLSYWNWNPHLAVYLAPLVSLASGPVVWCGATASGKLRQADGDPLMQTAGSAITGVGIAIMLVACLFARSHPIVAFVIAAAHFFTTAHFAFRREHHALHVPSLFFALLAWLSAFTAWEVRGFLDAPVWEIWWDRLTGPRIAAFALAIGVAAEGIARLGRTRDSRLYALFASGASVIGVILSTSFGQAEPRLAALTYAMVGAGFLAGNLRFHSVWASYLGAVLLVAATAWLMFYSSPGEYAAWSLAFAGCAMLIAVFGVVADRSGDFSSPLRSSITIPCLNVAAATGGLAAVLGAITGMGSAGWQASHIATAALLSLLYLVITAKVRWILTGTLAGLMLLATATIAGEWCAVRFALPSHLNVIALAVASATAVIGAVTLCLHSRLLSLGTDGRSERRSAVHTSWFAKLLRWEQHPVQQRREYSWLYVLPLALREVVITGSLLSLWIQFHAEGLTATRLPTFTLGFVAVALACVSLPLRTGVTTWAACVVGTAAIAHGLSWGTSLSLPFLAPFSLLALASFVLGVGLVLRRSKAANDRQHPLVRYVLKPGWHACLAATFIMPLTLVPIHVLGLVRSDTWLLAMAVAWLGGLWLLLALLRRSVPLWRCAQLALCGAAIYAVTAWMSAQPWAPVDSWWTPVVFECYGMGATLVLAAFILASQILARSESLRPIALGGWERPLMILGVAMALGLVEWGVLREVVAELVPSDLLTWVDIWPEVYSEAYGSGAWLLWGGLTALAIVALWHPLGPLASVNCLLVLLAILPALIAGGFSTDRASASALRWGASLAFLLGSIPLWFAEKTNRLRARIGIAEIDGQALDRLRSLHIDLNVPPVLALTAAAVAIAAATLELPGPTGGVFATVPPLVSYLVPVFLVGVTFTGFAWRQRSDGFAFTAGVTFLFGACASHVLAILISKGWIEVSDRLALLQVATIVAAGWAAVWYHGSRNFDESAAIRSPLWRLFTLVPALLLSIILAIAVIDLSGSAIWRAPGEVASVYPAASEWQRWTCSLLGWFALAVGLYATSLGRITSHQWERWGMLAPLAVAAMLATQIQVLWPGWGYRALLILMSTYVAAWMVLLFRHVDVTAIGTLVRLRQTARAGVIHGGLVLSLAGLHSYFAHHDFVWAITAITICGAAWTTTAARTRESSLYFAGSSVASAAIGLLVWSLAAPSPFDQWWGYLFYSVAIVFLGTASLWLLAVDRRKAGLESALPSLASLAQTTIGAIAAVIPVAVFVVRLVCYPHNPGTPSGVELGWPALALLIVLSLFASHRAGPRYLVHTVAIGAVLFAAQMAATLYAAGASGWISLFVLAYGTTLAPLCVAAMGLIRAAWSAGLPMRLNLHALRSRDIQAIWEILNLLAIGLVLRTVAAPGSQVVPILGAVAILILAAIVMHYWTGHAWYTIHTACLAIIGAIAVWWTSTESGGMSLLLAVAIALASAAAVCRLAEQASTRLAWVCHPRFPHPVLLVVLLFSLALARSSMEAWRIGTAREIFSAAGLASSVLLAALVSGLYLLSEVPSTAAQHSKEWTPVSSLAYWTAALGMLFEVVRLLAPVFEGSTSVAPGGFTWFAAGITFLAAGTFAYGRQPSRAPVFWAGLLFISLGLAACGLTWPQLARFGGIALAAYQTAFLGLSIWIAGPGLPIRRELLAEDEPWYVPGQWLVGLIVVVAALVTSLSAFPWSSRILGAGAIALLLPVFVRIGSTKVAAVHRYVAVAAGLVLFLALGWSVVDPASEHHLLGLHVMSIAAVGVAAVACGLILQRTQFASGNWKQPLRKSFAVLWAADVLLVPSVLTHELLRGASAEPPLWLQLVFAATVLALVASSIWFALRPDGTAARESEARRYVYVYVAEVLLVLLVVHLKMTGVIGSQLEAYRPLIIMGLAFLGVGIGELFRRQGLGVLAVPLQQTGVFLPVLPLLIFWWQGKGDGLFGGLHQLDFARYASFWFLAAGVYILMAAVRRSHRFALIAAVACNAGFWSILFHHREELGIWQHPQLWLIPPALILLIAEHLNRERLAEGTATALRYTGILMLYASSAADMFLAGTDNVAFSLVLAVLSVGGILAGIALRVLGFVLTGMVFLALVIGVRIWHSAVAQQQHWVWGLTAIGLGAAVLLLFALLERRRDLLRQAAEEIRRWKP